MQPFVSWAQRAQTTPPYFCGCVLAFYGMANKAHCLATSVNASIILKKIYITLRNMIQDSCLSSYASRRILAIDRYQAQPFGQPWLPSRNKISIWLSPASSIRSDHLVSSRGHSMLVVRKSLSLDVAGRTTSALPFMEMQS